MVIFHSSVSLPEGKCNKENGLMMWLGILDSYEWHTMIALNYPVSSLWKWWENLSKRSDNCRFSAFNLSFGGILRIFRMVQRSNLPSQRVKVYGETPITPPWKKWIEHHPSSPSHSPASQSLEMISWRHLMKLRRWTHYPTFFCHHPRR